MKIKKLVSDLYTLLENKHGLYYEADLKSNIQEILARYNAPNNSLLPDGKTCGDCSNFDRCKMLFNCIPEYRECDWSPHRFGQLERSHFEKDGIMVVHGIGEKNRYIACIGETHIFYADDIYKAADKAQAWRDTYPHQGNPLMKNQKQSPATIGNLIDELRDWVFKYPEYTATEKIDAIGDVLSKYHNAIERSVK